MKFISYTLVSFLYFNIAIAVELAAQSSSESGVYIREELDNHLPQYDPSSPQLYSQYLIGVPEIRIQTTVSHLPRLPRYVEGVYRNGIKGIKTRIVWPAPANNNAVSKAGSYEIIGNIPGTEITAKAIVIVQEMDAPVTPQISSEGFSLDQVFLDHDTYGNQTKFIENRDKFINTLAETNPDDFLYMFRDAFGQKQPENAQALEGWDSQETKLRGHATGHYLTALAQAYAGCTYDKSLQDNFAKKMGNMVDVLYELSQLSGQSITIGGTHTTDPAAVLPQTGQTDYHSNLSEQGIRRDYWNWGEGYISAYPPDQFIMLEKGAVYGRESNHVWAPYYTLHKILSGLLDIYAVSGNKKALKIAKGMGNWVHTRMSELSPETLFGMWSTYIAGEFGGMNELMARLYDATSEKQYLDAAKLFDNIKMFYGNANRSHGLAKNVDTFRGLHANQHIPQVIGALEMYGSSGSSDYYRIAQNFWYKAVHDYSYSIGGVAGARNPSNKECFTSEPATLYENGLSAGGQNETCATYNMLKLTRKLFLFDQRAELMDYYERGLYNHILASVAEKNPANTYHVPLRPGSIKEFGNPDMNGFTCCNGTALESNTKFQNSIYFKSTDNKSLYINLFIPSTLNWSERNISIIQSTAFPKEEITRLEIKGNGRFALHLRVPKWASKGFFVQINGKRQTVNAIPGTYITLSRNWKNGDTIELHMPFQFYLDPVMDQQNIASLFYGPILLAAQETEPRKEWRKIVLDASDIGKSINGDFKKLEFYIDGVHFRPFYDTYGRHSVYLDVTLK